MSDAQQQDPVVAKAITSLESQGRKARVVGRIKDGKIEIDPSDLAELANTHPNMVFLALNSPFDPAPCAAE